MSRIKKQYPAQLKLKAVLEMLKGDKTRAQVASEFEIHPMVLSDWKRRFLKESVQIFEKPGKANSSNSSPKDRDELFEQIGRLKVENDWLKKKLGLLE